MNLRISNGFIALGCVLLASCYPYNENAGKVQGAKLPDKTLSSPEQQKIKAQRDLAKKKDTMQKSVSDNDPAEKMKKESTTMEDPTTKPESGPSEKPKAAATEKPSYKVANKIPGKDGFVFSPYNNKVVDVRDIPTGTLVQDPTYPASEKKYFRVP